MSGLGMAHVAFGVLALVSGTFVMVRRKGTPGHVLSGRLFALAMLALNATAFMIYQLFGGFGPFHLAAVGSTGTLIAGVWPALRRKPGWLGAHAYYMKWTYVGLLAATGAEITSRVPGWDFFWSVSLPSLGIIVIGGSFIGWKRPAQGSATVSLGH